ncbi:hypothetical protein [Bartonella refiksaydamii]|uniref:hypothetical protein n=1 Tax=Bartonella refiksaydamii TaxID=2654951 RepID=UPI0012EB686F|nr:hypothetical protein [Bartonella refiksaydamii]
MMRNVLDTHVFATRFKQYYRAVRKDERNRIGLYCCFENATTTFRVAVEKICLTSKPIKSAMARSAFSLSCGQMFLTQDNGF